MANATTTIAGDIQLAGDLAGNNNAASPTLSNTGVTPGTYTNALYTVDSKGRITSAANNSLPVATTTTSGVVQIGSGLSVTDGVVSVVTTNFALLNATNFFTKAQHSQPSALTSGTTIAVNGSLSNVYTLTIGHNATLANPTTLGVGTYVFIITQDAIGSRSLAYGTSYKFKFGADTTISTAANSVNILTCTSNGTSLYCSLAKNFV